MANGTTQNMTTQVHNPEFSKKRKCDGLIPMFKKESVLQEFRIGKADCLLLDASKMLKSMIHHYENNGVTMYTPNGELIEGYE